LGVAAGRQLLSSFSKALSLFGETFLKGLFVFDAASLHDAILLTFAPPINIKPGRIFRLSLSRHFKSSAKLKS
jgi:hypothetical protein